ncbi:MAG: HXXEE domain-containing protein [Phenylobacterium sp.]
MSLESLMWSFAIVFMLHELEEIIMLKPWLARNAAVLTRRFPTVGPRIVRRYGPLSTSAIALAILEQFVILSLVILASVVLRAPGLWAGVLTGYLVHIVGHLGQAAIFRGYCPFLFTSLLSLPYGAYSLARLYGEGLLSPIEHLAWTAAAIPLIAVNLLFAMRLASLFEAWLRRNMTWTAADQACARGRPHFRAPHIGGGGHSIARHPSEL